jgi:hypothetical protein
VRAITLQYVKRPDPGPFHLQLAPSPSDQELSALTKELAIWLQVRVLAVFSTRVIFCLDVQSLKISVPYLKTVLIHEKKSF